MKQFIREYRIELVAAFMALLGIFLLVEQMEIRVTIFRIMSLVWRTVGKTMVGVVRAVIYRLLHIRPSDLLGLVLILLSIVIVFWRVRVRVLQRLAGSTCPVCGADLRRSRRDRLDRLVSLLLPVRPYRCRNQECRWQGLRVQTHR
jgi:hypothetical protein